MYNRLVKALNTSDSLWFIIYAIKQHKNRYLSNEDYEALKTCSERIEKLVSQVVNDLSV